MDILLKHPNRKIVRMFSLLIKERMQIAGTGYDFMYVGKHMLSDTDKICKLSKYLFSNIFFGSEDSQLLFGVEVLYLVFFCRKV